VHWAPSASLTVTRPVRESTDTTVPDTGEVHGATAGSWAKTGTTNNSNKKNKITGTDILSLFIGILLVNQVSLSKRFTDAYPSSRGNPGFILVHLMGCVLMLTVYNEGNRCTIRLPPRTLVLSIRIQTIRV
jgi:hypothetical protein